MSARRMLSIVGTIVGDLVGWTDGPVPAADPDSVRSLFADLGLIVGENDNDLTAALRRFQARVDLETDGVAGKRTVHLLAHYAKKSRELRRFERSVTA